MAARKAGRQLRCPLHGYHGCYCYLPLYAFRGNHLPVAKPRRSNIDASAGSVEEVARLVGQIRARWPLRGRPAGRDPCGTGSTAQRSMVRVILRADGGFACEGLMVWAEQHRVDYVLGLARNPRLVGEIAAELALAKWAAEETGQAARALACVSVRRAPSRWPPATPGSRTGPSPIEPSRQRRADHDPDSAQSTLPRRDAARGRHKEAILLRRTRQPHLCAERTRRCSELPQASNRKPSSETRASATQLAD